GRILLDGSATPLQFTNPVEVRSHDDGAGISIQGTVNGLSLRVVGDVPVQVGTTGAQTRIQMSDATNASSVAFESGAQLAGDVLLVADQVDFLGGALSIQAQPGATLSVRPLDPARTVAVGSDAGGVDGAFQFGALQTAALGDGFASIEIGHVDRSAPLVFRGEADFRDALVLWGSTVEMQADSVLRSTAGVTLASASAATVGQVIAAGQKVTVRSEQADSVIASSRPAGQTNITAQEVVVEGLGPQLGQGQALRINSDKIDVLSPTGMVGRQAQVNGDVHLVVMVDGRTHLQAVVGATNRLLNATAQTTLPGGSSAQGQVSVAQDRVDRSFFLASGVAAPLFLGFGLGADTEPAVRRVDALAVLPSSRGAEVEDLSGAEILWALPADQTTDDGQDLERAYALGLPGSQPLHAGMLDGPLGSFDYWVESLTI
ncbi:MAG: hypothetical protein RLZ83_271, partial [Pseudomonadota bacterium]